MEFVNLLSSLASVAGFILIALAVWIAYDRLHSSE